MDMSRQKTKPPIPIFDNLDVLMSDANDPWHLESFNSDHAADDYRSVLKFLIDHAESSEDTFTSYRRDAERLLQWCWRIADKSILTLDRDDISQFMKFMVSPPAAWVGTKNVARFKNSSKTHSREPNADWRPFVRKIPKSASKSAKSEKQATTKYQMSTAAINACFRIISAFYDRQMKDGVLPINPVAQMPRGLRKKLAPVTEAVAPKRRLTDLQWSYVIETAELMTVDPEHERTLFIMTALYGMYLRISEIVGTSMGDFRQDEDQNWWFHVQGKGDKPRRVTVSDTMLSALKRYREYLGLPSLPSVGDNTPILMSNRDGTAIKSSRSIRYIVQKCFDDSYERMKKDFDDDSAETLKACTVHWLRHTGISVDVQRRPRSHVRDDAGHSHMSTTDSYIDSDDRERHETARKKPISEV